MIPPFLSFLLRYPKKIVPVLLAKIKVFLKIIVMLRGIFICFHVFSRGFFKKPHEFFIKKATRTYYGKLQKSKFEPGIEIHECE